MRGEIFSADNILKALVIRACVLLVSAVGVVVAEARGEDSARIAVKRLFAPAADVEQGLLRVPEPAETPTRSQITVRTGEFAAASARASVVRFEFVHAGGVLRLIPLGVDACRWRGRIIAGTQAIPLDGEDALVSRVEESFASQTVFGLDDATRVFELDAPAGACVVEFWSELPAGSVAALVIDDRAGSDGAPALVAHLGSRVQRVGGALELVVRGEERAPVPLDAARRVEVHGASVEWSDGTVEQAGAVRRSRDGSVRVVFERARRGNAIIRIDGLVFDGRGVAHQRSLAYLTRVSDGARFAGESVVHSDGASDAWVHCDFAVELADHSEEVFACAELWAVGGAKERVLGWIGGIAEVERVAVREVVREVVRLGFDRRMARLGDGEQLVFRNLRLHERDGFALLDLRAELAPDLHARLAGEPAVAAESSGAEAWTGPPGIATVRVPAITAFLPPEGSHALVLSHGYCADANPWPLAQFAGDAWPYENLEQSLSNDAFAVDLAARAAQFKSYGIVGHSQGGCAALHLYAFYWSGLDWAGPGRLMQCVGAPLKGTPLAGNLAALGAALGIQCGSNYDITPDGAAVWLAGIPSAARARLHTYTTTFTNVPFFYDYCNIVTDAFLSDPEDGVVESAAGHIVGGQNMGLTTGWCHVSGMRDPAQTGDASRNAVLNAQGAR